MKKFTQQGLGIIGLILVWGVCFANTLSGSLPLTWTAEVNQGMSVGATQSVYVYINNAVNANISFGILPFELPNATTFVQSSCENNVIPALGQCTIVLNVTPIAAGLIEGTLVIKTNSRQDTLLSNIRLNVTAPVAVNTLAYVANFNGASVSRCPIDFSGPCTALDPGGIFNEPFDIAFNTANTLAYISNFGTSELLVCPVLQTGDFVACTPFGGFSEPTGIALNATNNIGYVANANTNSVSVCQLDPSSGAVLSCINNPDVSFNDPVFLALNAENTFLYVTNINGGTVSVCPTNPFTGAITGPCVPSAAIFSGPAGIVLNATNTIAYIANSTSLFGVFSVSVCTGDFSAGAIPASCTNYDPGITFSAPRGVALNVANTLLYVANAGGAGAVSVCTLNAGAISSCTNNPDPSFNGLTGIALNKIYV